MKKFFATLLLCLFVTTSAFAAGNFSVNNQMREINAASVQTIKNLYAKYFDARRVIGNCYGYVTLTSTAERNSSSALRGIGVGVAYNNKTGERHFVRMAPKSALARNRLNNYELVFIIYDSKAWENFLAGKTRFIGENTTMNLDDNSTFVISNIEGMKWVAKDVFVFQVGKEISDIGAALQDMKITQIQTTSLRR